MGSLTTRATSNDGDSDWKAYYYEPSLPAAIIFIVLFALSTSLHMFQMIRSRTWFMVPFVIGCICKKSSIKHLTSEVILTRTA